MILINPKSPNPHKFKGIEPPIWCALLANNTDTIVDYEVGETAHVNGENMLIVVMGNNPSVSSTPKMPEAERLEKSFKRDGGEVYITGLHPMSTGQATYGFPDPTELVGIRRAKWELLDMSKYRAHNWQCLHDIDNTSGYAALYTSYGCPFNCEFCNVHTLYGGRGVTFREPEDVIDEIEFLVKNYNIKHLRLCDELFTLNHDHVNTICRGIKDFNLNIWAYAKVGTVTPELLKTMKEAGFNWLCYGFESANKEVLKGVHKDIGDLWDTVNMTKEAGINILGNFMFGLPSDTSDSMMETLKLAESINCEYVNFYCAMSYPGSQMFDGGNLNWDSYNQYGKIGVPDWVKTFRDAAFQRYFKRPEYFEMIRGKFGERAVAHINEMLESG